MNDTELFQALIGAKASHEDGYGLQGQVLATPQTAELSEPVTGGIDRREPASDLVLAAP